MEIIPPSSGRRFCRTAFPSSIEVFYIWLTKAAHNNRSDLNGLWYGQVKKDTLLSRLEQFGIRFQLGLPASQNTGIDPQVASDSL